MKSTPTCGQPTWNQTSSATSRSSKQPFFTLTRCRPSGRASGKGHRRECRQQSGRHASQSRSTGSLMREPAKPTKWREKPTSQLAQQRRQPTRQLVQQRRQLTRRQEPPKFPTPRNAASRVARDRTWLLAPLPSAKPNAKLDHHLLLPNGPRKGFAQRAAQEEASRKQVAASYPRPHQAPLGTEAQGPSSQSQLIPSRADAVLRNSGPGTTRTWMTVMARPTICSSQPRAILRLRHPDQGQKFPRMASAPEPLETIRARDRPMPLSATRGSA
jgi:hypothetical protein